MKPLQRGLLLPLTTFSSRSAPQMRRRLLNIQHLVWIRLEPLGRNRGRPALHVSPRFLTEGGKGVGSYFQLTLILQTFCWVGTSNLVIMNSWAWWNHLETFPPRGRTVIMHHCIMSRFLKWHYCSLTVESLQTHQLSLTQRKMTQKHRCLVESITESKGNNLPS